MMEEVEHSDFTMDIIDTRQFKIDVDKKLLNEVSDEVLYDSFSDNVLQQSVIEKCISSIDMEGALVLPAISLTAELDSKVNNINIEHKVACPICHEKFSGHLIEIHADAEIFTACTHIRRYATARH